MYFDGCVTDGELRIRIVGLSAEQQRKLASYKEEQAAYLTNCELKPSREGTNKAHTEKRSKIDKPEKNKYCYT